MKIKIGDRVHYENAVDWYEGVVKNIETRKTPPSVCEECGTKLTKGGKKYIHYDIDIQKAKTVGDFTGQLDSLWLNKKFIKFYKLPPLNF